MGPPRISFAICKTLSLAPSVSMQYEEMSEPPRQAEKVLSLFGLVFFKKPFWRGKERKKQSRERDERLK